jgi:mannitol/fructose-specific phosphotransferase system IIA component (Ntr-type)
MQLRDFIRDGDVRLDLSARTKDAALAELIALLDLPPEQDRLLVRVLERRESLGSTGIGAGVAIPHCRTQLVGRLRVLFGRSASGIEWEAIDHRPVHYVFLLVAPPIEVSNDYLPVLGRIAQLMKDPGVAGRLAGAGTVEQFFGILDQKSG